ncbi:MAG: methionyl-tRNA formyltransferase [Lachnospiraceae bacterium]|nr:methionyl-tRNA formyltransferase [Lachnospiraceae bacterium]MCD7766438.1 methionyl-tRNA formyltransferase [Lachnospiraceae bacterium]
MLQNVVFMGTPDFAVGTLNALIVSDKYRVQAVFSQPDKPKGRKKELQMTPVKAAAAAAGIPVYQPVKIREPQWLDVLKEMRPDAIVVVAFGQIIPQTILDLPEYGCINVHASLLPKYRGAAPIQWAVIDGEKESGVTTMRMDAGLDTGDMILKEVVPLAEDETGGSLFDKLSQVGAQLLIRTLDALDKGTAQFEKQPEMSPTTYASMLTKEDGRIDWQRSAHEIECRIRGVDPWPGAWTGFRGKTLKVWKAKVPGSETGGEETARAGSAAAQTGLTAATETTEPAEAKTAEQTEMTAPGTVCAVTKSSLYVQTGHGVLSILELQPEGKKRMEIGAFLRGYPVKPGEKLETVV